jgi:dTDP-glucose pyrophosphorylase
MTKEAKMLNIVIPMAGRGSRFVTAGYELPKPLIDIHGKPMISYVIHNVTPSCSHRFIFICLQEHVDKYHIDEILRRYVENCIIVTTSCVTEGAACTILLAEEYINNSDPLMIANSDQYVDTDINAYINYMETTISDGLVMTMTSNEDKWSYIRLSEDNSIIEIREKEVISEEATVGIYNYRAGADYVKYAKEMIRAEDRVNNEFYVAPVYNYMIRACKKIVHYNIGAVNKGMYGLGIPKDLEYFMSLPLSVSVSNLIQRNIN